MALDLISCTCHYLKIIKLEKLTLGGCFITNPLVACQHISPINVECADIDMLLTGWDEELPTAGPVPVAALT